MEAAWRAQRNHGDYESVVLVTTSQQPHGINRMEVHRLGGREAQRNDQCRVGQALHRGHDRPRHRSAGKAAPSGLDRPVAAIGRSRARPREHDEDPRRTIPVVRRASRSAATWLAARTDGRCRLWAARIASTVRATHGGATGTSPTPTGASGTRRSSWSFATARSTARPSTGLSLSRLRSGAGNGWRP